MEPGSRLHKYFLNILLIIFSLIFNVNHVIDDPALYKEAWPIIIALETGKMNS